MAELIAKTPAAGLLPLTIGTVELSEVDAGHLTSIAPFKGMEKLLSDALNTAHGASLPGANLTTGKTDARVIWFGLNHVLLTGPVPDTGLAKFAALTDQSDAWTAVQLRGAGSVDVLARLVPVDLRDTTVMIGHTLRTQVMHMNASITRIGSASFQIMVFRSMAETLVHDLRSAMEGVAARG
mgnify:CR=1 FL=1